MNGVRHRDLHAGHVLRAADAHVAHRLQSLVREVLADFKEAHDRRAGGPRHVDDVGRVVAVSVRQQNQIDGLQVFRLRQGRGTIGVAEPGIGEHTLARGQLEQERGVAKPGNCERHQVGPVTMISGR